MLSCKFIFDNLPGEIEGIHEGSSVRVTRVLVNIRNAQAYKSQI